MPLMGWIRLNRHIATMEEIKTEVEEVLTGSKSFLDNRLPSFPVSSIDNVSKILDARAVLLEYRLV